MAGKEAKTKKAEALGRNRAQGTPPGDKVGLSTLMKKTPIVDSIINRLPVVLYVLDDEGRFIWWNKRFEEVYGYSPEEMVQLSATDLIAEKDREAVARKIREAFTEGEAEIEVVAVSREGKRFPFYLVAVRFTMADRAYLAGIGLDISKRRQLEEKFSQSEEKYRTVVENAKEIIVVLQDQKYQFVNPRMSELTGYSYEELMSRPCMEFVHPDDLQLVYDRYSRRLRGEVVPGIYVHRLVTKDGATLWVQANAKRIMWEGRPAVLSMMVDITHLHKTEEELRESEEKYRILVENANDAIVVVQDERFKFANPKMMSLIGYSLEEMNSRHFIDFVHPDDRGLVFERYSRRIRGEEVPHVYTHRLITKEGKTHWVEVNANRIFWEGKPAILSILTNITERKRVEEERKRWEQMAQVTSRLAAVGEMASGVAHEINNPLTSVIGFSQLLMQKDLSDDIKKDLAIINEGAQRVADIVCTLLTFARQQKPERRLVDINELITTTLDLRSYALRADNIRVTTQFEPELPLTIADAGQLQQVFLNIIMNAEKEMKLAHGKGSLSIKTEHTGNTIRISFKDNGPGIAEEYLEKIFEPFFTTRKVGEGTGLGLSLCYGIVTAHRGRIWAESKPGKGATFIVELPVVIKEEQLGLPEPREEKPQIATKARILVVDDEPTTLQFLNRLLTEEGHEVDTAGKATEALEKVRDKRYKLILLDIKMPDMSGIELYEKLQKIAKSLTQRVLFITGDVMGARTAAFLSRTKAPYITKPFNIEQLKKEINNMLSE